MLYFRQILIMLVSLYTVRVVLETLGAEDYGIYNVVAGVVTLFGFLSNSMATASQRFFAFELGRGDFERLERIFSLSLLIYALIVLIVLLLAETIGLWFVTHKLIIPPERMGAARWIYQFSIVSFVFTIMASPFMAAIIAHEDMNIYAAVSIVEAVLKLGIVFMLKAIALDKLQLYGILVCAVTVINTGIYRTICKLRYQECKFRFYWDKGLFREITGFVGWSLFGSFAWLIRSHGSNIVINLFFGPLVNAARGIALQVNSAVTALCDSFTKAVYPQIIKSYTKNDKKYTWDLVLKSSKFSYLLLLFLSMPLLLETDFLMALWLKNVPEYTVFFVRLVLIDALVTAFTYSIGIVNQATGDIKLYQGIIGGFLILNLPASVFLFRSGFGPEWSLGAAIILSFVALLSRLVLLRWQIKFPVWRYLKEVLAKMIITTFAAFVFPLFLQRHTEQSVIRFILVCITSVCCCCLSTYFTGLNRFERLGIRDIIQNKINKNLYIMRNRI
jgi:O-antigen/teichoic acid export membrane protein